MRLLAHSRDWQSYYIVENLLKNYHHNNRPLQQHNIIQLCQSVKFSFIRYKEWLGNNIVRYRPSKFCYIHKSSIANEK